MTEENDAKFRGIASALGLNPDAFAQELRGAYRMVLEDFEAKARLAEQLSRTEPAPDPNIEVFGQWQVRHDEERDPAGGGWGGPPTEAWYVEPVGTEDDYDPIATCYERQYAQLIATLPELLLERKHLESEVQRLNARVEELEWEGAHLLQERDEFRSAWSTAAADRDETRVALDYWRGLAEELVATPEGWENVED